MRLALMIVAGAILMAGLITALELANGKKRLEDREQKLRRVQSERADGKATHNAIQQENLRKQNSKKWMEDLERERKQTRRELSELERFVDSFIDPNDPDVVSCPRCKGEGRTPKQDPCWYCSGAGFIKQRAASED